MFYSKSTGGFYDLAIHNELPADAVEITQEEHAALMSAQALGKLIQPDVAGKPIAVDPLPLTGNALILSQIAALEETITPRRMREAVLGVDNGWLKGVNDKLAALRGQLK